MRVSLDEMADLSNQAGDLAAEIAQDIDRSGPLATVASIQRVGLAICERLDALTDAVNSVEMSLRNGVKRG